MTQETISQKPPKTFATPFADSGDRNAIPDTGVDAVNIQQGFPSIFSTPRANSGKSVARRDMNGILNSLSSLNYYFQYMGRNPWVSGTSYPKGAKVWYDNAEWISPFDNNTTAPGGQNKDGEDAWIAINDLGGTVGGSGDGDSGTTLDLQKIVEELTLLNDNINKNHLNRFSSDDICETFIGEYTMRYTGYVSGTGYFQVNGTQKHDSFKGLTHIRQGTLLYSTQTCYAIYSPQSITFSSIPTVTYGDDFPCKESSAAIVLSETNVNKVTFTFTEEYFSTVQSHRYTDLVLSRITARASQKEIRTNVSFPIYNQPGASYTRTCSCYIWPKQNLRIMISRISNTINGTYYDFYDSSEYLSGLSVSVYEEAA